MVRILEAKQKNFYTEKEYECMEHDGLIEYDSGIVMMFPAPGPVHQALVRELNAVIRNYLLGKPYKVYPAPFDVRLVLSSGIKRTQPDLSVICDKRKITHKGCEGAPDFIIEVVSTHSKKYDYLTKLKWYEEAKVKEYWIVNPLNRTVLVYMFEKGEIEQYNFNDTIPVGIWEGDLKIDFSQLDLE